MTRSTPVVDLGSMEGTPYTVLGGQFNIHIQMYRDLKLIFSEADWEYYSLSSTRVREAYMLKLPVDYYQHRVLYCSGLGCSSQHLRKHKVHASNWCHVRCVATQPSEPSASACCSDFQMPLAPSRRVPPSIQSYSTGTSTRHGCHPPSPPHRSACLPFIADALAATTGASHGSL